MLSLRSKDCSCRRNRRLFRRCPFSRWNRTASCLHCNWELSSQKTKLGSRTSQERLLLSGEPCANCTRRRRIPHAPSPYARCEPPRSVLIQAQRGADLAVLLLYRHTGWCCRDWRLGWSNDIWNGHFGYSISLRLWIRFRYGKLDGYGLYGNFLQGKAHFLRWGSRIKYRDTQGEFASVRPDVGMLDTQNTAQADRVGSPIFRRAISII